MPVTASVTGGARAELPQLLKGLFCLKRTALYCTTLSSSVYFCDFEFFYFISFQSLLFFILRQASKCLNVHLILMVT